MGCKKLDISKNYESVLTVVGKYPTIETQQVGNFLATKKGCVNYFPFGSTFDIPRDVNNPTSEGYRYGFNGKEKDDEVKGGGNSYDFGARIYDPRIPVMLSRDPMGGVYPNLTPYSAMGGNPIGNIDYNGELILFVNGFNPGHEGANFLELQDYWDVELQQAAAQTMNDNYAMFFDGSSSIASAKNSTARGRTTKGSAAALKYALQIKEMLEHQRNNGDPSAKLNFVSHSMGGAYAVGMINMLFQAVDPETGEHLFSEEDFGDAYFLAPYQSADITSPDITNNKQYSHINDIVAGSNRMKNIGKTGSFKSKFDMGGASAYSNTIQPHLNDRFKYAFSNPGKDTKKPYNMGGSGMKYRQKSQDGGKRKVSKGGSF